MAIAPPCQPGFDTLVANAKAAISAKIADYKAKLQELRDMDMQQFINEAIDQGLAAATILYQNARDAILAQVQSLLGDVFGLIDDLAAIVELLSGLAFGDISAVTEKLTEILSEIPGVGALIAAYETALAAAQC
jgi:hypothetical protein